LGTAAPTAERSRPLRDRGLLLFAAAAVAVPLLFAAYTGHIWEDYFITFKHSKNLCEGHGLVYQPGERVHGFTSPLGTLLPALCYVVTGGGSYEPALWLFRALSALAFAGAGVLFLMALRLGGSGPSAQLAFAALYLLNAPAVDFTINGMETGFMLLFVGWGIYLLAADDPRRWLALGVCAAGLMWTRPDGCVYIAAFAVAGLLFAAGPRRPRLLALVKAAAVCTVLYAPWFLWAWTYYGSPVPNTIRAKASYNPEYHNLLEPLLVIVQSFPIRIATVFRPAYSNFGGWPLWVDALSQAVGIVCAAYWLLPINDRLGRLCSFCFFALSLYLSFLAAAFPWYCPPVAACGLVVLARAISSPAGSAGSVGRLVRAAALAGVVLVAVTSLWTFAMVARQMQIQQEEIEWGNRAELGRWLKDNVAPGERVYLECLGYIGYFSEAKMLDNPGLVSPEVVAAAREEPSGLVAVGLRLKAEWIVLRPYEREKSEQRAELLRRYDHVATFDASDGLRRRGDFTGDGYLWVDAVFEVYKRRPEPASPGTG
jgi:hypothetical protein